MRLYYFLLFFWLTTQLTFETQIVTANTPPTDIYAETIANSTTNSPHQSPSIPSSVFFWREVELSFIPKESSLLIKINAEPFRQFRGSIREIEVIKKRNQLIFKGIAASIIDLPEELHLSDRIAWTLFVKDNSGNSISLPVTNESLSSVIARSDSPNKLKQYFEAEIASLSSLERKLSNALKKSEELTKATDNTNPEASTTEQPHSPSIAAVERLKELVDRARSEISSSNYDKMWRELLKTHKTTVEKTASAYKNKKKKKELSLTLPQIDLTEKENLEIPTTIIPQNPSDVSTKPTLEDDY